jgi:hypothetical protein
MKELLQTDYVLYDPKADAVVCDTKFKTVIYGSMLEALEDKMDGEVVMSCTDLPLHHQKVLIKEINS